VHSPIVCIDNRDTGVAQGGVDGKNAHILLMSDRPKHEKNAADSAEK
jgi:hypothetical protein